ncbi:putative transcriptional regulator, LysR family [Methylorubrum extorquens DM4]|uniref:Transcriptional regulator, LysR family n=1 Tax=Methylorubrum extorquens (strain DSM 6343 / CIP 106787 / DM4) TaxID=661410 RepID=C7CMK8_METED|nr:LysR family transcriptional regulator [Methylorubrum extorquens]CAX27003.1 putative transcriptional regulator, LysR family [Methylorubrum extorquens DM4]
MRFDLTDLRLFLHVVEAESITRGAERAGLALASASERIRGMEADGGVPLLERHARGVRPTPAGLAVVHHARLVLGQLEQMRGELGQYARGLRGHVRLLSITAAVAAFLPDALSGFLASHPSVDIDLEERTSRETVDALAGGLADLGIVADTTDLGALETRPLLLDRIVLAVPAGHALAQRSGVAFREVLDEPLVGLSHGRALQAHLATHAARAGRPFKLRVRLNGLDAVCRMVERGVGVAIVPEAAAQRAAETLAIRAIPIDEPWTVRQLRLCARSFAALPPHARQLAEHLLAHLGAAESPGFERTSPFAGPGQSPG